MKMAKNKLEKHLEELGEGTSGGAHDAVTFAGKGLNLLSSLFKSEKNNVQPLEKGEYDDPSDMDLDELEDFIDDNDVDGAPEQRDGESDDRYTKRLRRFLKKWISGQGEKKTKKNANGGELEAEDDDLIDPANGTDGDIITNKGKQIPKDALAAAVKKNSSGFDERRFEKNFDEIESEHGDILDASPALGSLAQQMRAMAKSTSTGMVELQNSIVVLAKGLEQSLNAQASLAADLELIKKQPGNSPAPGFVVMNKNSGGNGGGRKLLKSDVQDSLISLMQKGEVDPAVVSQLDFCRNDRELESFVNSLPQNIQDQL